MKPVTALVLAGSRGPCEPMARYAGVTHKALIEVGGSSMLERVVKALDELPQVTRILVSIERPELLDELPDLQGGRLKVEPIAAAGSPSRSVAAALEQCGTPLLVTTADHALLETEWLDYFLTHCPPQADACVALASREAILAEVPDTHRTWLRFSGDAAYSGCNLFLFATPASQKVAEFWQRIEAERKRPLRMVGQLGYLFALRYLLRQLSLDSALSRLGRLAGVKVAAVELPFGRAAIDVDKPSDLELARRLVES